jgi:SAM-dependent methyltransferase
MNNRSGANFASPREGVSLGDCYWYHVMELPGIGETDGIWDLRGRFSEYIGGVGVAGKTVLDIGAASGFLSFSAEKAGATEVVSFDIDVGDRQHLLPFQDSLYYRDHSTWAKARTKHFDLWKNAYWFAHRALKSNARVAYGDVYDLDPNLGQFDVVIIGAVLEHLSDPIRALASIARKAAHTLVISTDVIESDEPIAKFMGDAKRPEIDYVFWTYSTGVYRQVLEMLGFQIMRTTKSDFNYRVLKGSFPRTAIVAERIA